MSVFVPTGANVAVDPLDVLLVAPNGSTGTTLYLAQGQPVVVAALPAAVVAELNTAAGLVGPDTLFTTPVAASEWPSPVYIAGAQVKRVQPSGATNLGSMVLFALSGFMVTVPAVDLTAMMALINATTTGGGGGTAEGYTNIGQWEENLTDPNGTTVYGSTFGPPYWFRVGPESASGPETGDLVTVGFTVPFSGEVVADQPALLVSGFPFPPTPSGAFSYACTLAVDTQPDVSFSVALPPTNHDVLFAMQGVAVGPFAGLLSFQMTFEVDAS